MEKLEHFGIRGEVITGFHPICVTNGYQSTQGLGFPKRQNNLRCPSKVCPRSTNDNNIIQNSSGKGIKLLFIC